MHLQRRPALVGALATVALGLSCSNAEPSRTGTGGSPGSAGVSGTAGATGTAGTNGGAGTTASAGTTGSAGSTGDAGTTGSAGTVGTTGTAGAAGTTGVAGTTSAAGTTGTGGRGGTTGVAGSIAGGRGGTGGAIGRGGAGGTTGGTAGSGIGGAAPSAGCGITDWLKSGRASIDSSGTTREYVLKIPDGYDTNKPYRLIFAWHWRGGSANDVVTGTVGGGPYYGLEQRAAGSAIFVSPEGIDAGFANTNGRDSAFLRAMLARFNSKLCIDQGRIFSTGFSYGGMMSDSIGCEMADVFRAIAPMSGAITNAAHQYSGCTQTNSHPIAVWMSHGDADTVVPLADGKAALDLFVSRNQCQTQTAPVSPSPCVAYQGCSAGYPIHWCQFSGGHMAPSFASAAIWTFFSQF